MGNQSIKSTVRQQIKSLYQKGQKYEEAYDYQLALYCYRQILDKIQSLSHVSAYISQLQYDIYYHICVIYLQQNELTKANQAILEAQQLAKKFKEWLD